MSDKNFINFHVLISHSPSCLNRDDMNMQKTAVFGGVQRVRISSQSLKRAIRFSSYYRQTLGEPSKRSRDLGKLKEFFLEKLQGEFEPALIIDTVERFVRAKSADQVDEDDGSVDVEQAEGKDDKTVAKKLAVAPWVVNEIRELAKIVGEARSIGLTDVEIASANDKFTKQKPTAKKKKTLQDFKDELLDKKIERAVKEKSEILEAALSSAVDIAFSGRMATSGLMTSVDGAMSVAHAITTHASEADIDWFTAVDDLIVDAGAVGSGHLDTQEFSAGVFYRYASLNIGQLQQNLGNVSRERALEIAAHALHLLATVVPTAKQQSFAAHNLADMVLVSFSDMPISLANAFESPVKKADGFLRPSILRLSDYWQKVHQGYGLDERTVAFCLQVDKLADGLLLTPTLPALENWVRQDGKVEV